MQGERALSICAELVRLALSTSYTGTLPCGAAASSLFLTYLREHAVSYFILSNPRGLFGVSACINRLDRRRTLSDRALAMVAWH